MQFLPYYVVSLCVGYNSISVITLQGFDKITIQAVGPLNQTLLDLNLPWLLSQSPTFPTIVISQT